MLRMAVLTFLATLGLCTSALADAYSTRPSDEVIREATAACTRGSVSPPSDIIGISDPHTLDPGVVELIAESGVKWVRAEFHWSRIQQYTNSDYYDWREYDRMVDNFNAKGIKVAGILTYIPSHLPPDWAVIDSQFQRFAAAAVERYAAKGVHYWEVFNEPNLTGYGWLPKYVNARDFLGAYTLLLARANQIIRSHDPDGVVILGGLASDNHGGIRAEETMKFIYDRGGKDCFDVFAFHPYGYQNQFPAARSRVRSIMSAGNDLDKPIWFNEYGWIDYKAMDMAVNETAQTNPMMAVFSQKDQADALFWFAAKDYSAKWGTPTFGLADFNLKKRKSLKTFQQLMQKEN